MNRKRNVWISLAAAVLSGLLVYCIYVLQIRQVALQETIDVVVPNRFVKPGERLTAEMLTLKPIAAASLAPDMMTQVSAVIGQETAIPLGSGEPLLGWKIGDYRLLPRREQLTFQIPREYVLSVSNGIRAGDRVAIYYSGKEGSSQRLFEPLVTVASVKSSGNQEVDDMKNSNLLSLASGDKEQMYVSRRDANAMIEHINLNLSEAQWLQIDELCKQGLVKLVIAFSPESLDVSAHAIAVYEEVKLP